MRREPATWEEPFAISTMPCFLDFVWDADMMFNEMDALDSAVVIDAVNGPRRVVVQRIRGELRYWLATHRDPMTMTNLGKDELGIVSSIADLATLCHEFLNMNVPIRELRSARLAVHLSGDGPVPEKGRAE